MNLKKTIEYLFYLVVFLLPWQTVWIWREVFVNGDKWEYGVIGLYGIDIFIILLIVLSLAEYFKNNNFQFFRQRRTSLGLAILKFKTIFNNLILKLKNLRNVIPEFFVIKKYPESKLQIKHILTRSRIFFGKNSGMTKLVYVLVIWSFLSISWSPDKILVLYFSFKIFLAVGMFWTVMKIKLDWRKLIAVLLLAGALQGGLATGQFLIQKDFESSILGTSQHLASQGGSSVIESESGRWLRAYGTFAHPNILGGYLAVTLLIILIYGLIIKNYEENLKFKISNFYSIFNDLNLKLKDLKFISNFKLKISDYGYVLSLTSYALILSGLIVSFSRSAWMVFAIGFILLFIFQKEKRRELAKLAVVFLGVGLIWLSAFSPLFFSRTAGQGRLEQKSLDDRSEYVLQAKEIIGNNFWLGVGAGNYTKYLYDPLPTSPLEKGRGMTPIWKIQPVHNVFLLIWSELGLIGLFLFIVLSLGIFIEGYKNNKILTLLLYVSFFMLCVVDHWLWTSHFGLIFFFLILGSILKKKKEIDI